MKQSFKQPLKKQCQKQIKQSSYGHLKNGSKNVLNKASDHHLKAVSKIGQTKQNQTLQKQNQKPTKQSFKQPLKNSVKNMSNKVATDTQKIAQKTY